jgi:hypothetical protein
MKKMSAVAYTLFLLTLVYIGVAFAVFELRHPWTTNAEQRAWMWSAVRFNRVPYEVMRQRTN